MIKAQKQIYLILVVMKMVIHTMATIVLMKLIIHPKKKITLQVLLLLLIINKICIYFLVIFYGMNHILSIYQDLYRTLDSRYSRNY